MPKGLLRALASCIPYYDLEDAKDAFLAYIDSAYTLSLGWVHPGNQSTRGYCKAAKQMGLFIPLVTVDIDEKIVALAQGSPFGMYPRTNGMLESTSAADGHMKESTD